MKGVDVVAGILKAEGVEFIACFPHNDLIEACARVGIRPIVCRQERVGLAIADGYSRTKNGRGIGVFVCQHGPGAENAFPGVAQAFADNIPILVLPAGEVTAREGVRPVFSSYDNFAHVTKWRARFSSARRIAPVLRHAFYRLRTGVGGPVLVEMPLDVMAAEVDAAPAYQPTRGSVCGPDPAAVAEVAQALADAAHPVLYAGQGVLFAEATEQLVRLAEMLEAPVLTTTPGKSAFPETHPLSLGASAITKPEHLMHYLDTADCVFGIGTSLTHTVYGTSVPAGKLMIQATNSEADVNKDYAVDHVLLGDAKLSLQALIIALEELGVDRGLGSRAEGVLAAKRAFLESWREALTSDELPMNQFRVVGELMQRLDPARTIITHDAGTPREQIVSFWEAPNPRAYLGWGKTTQLGFGLGAIMGAKLAAPEKLCINIMGDSAIGMVGLDIETAVRSRIGILTIVFNNGIMAIETNALEQAHRQFGANFQGGHYADMAVSLGAWARRVETPDAFVAALIEALSVVEHGHPAVIECVVKAGYDWPGRDRFTH